MSRPRRVLRGIAASPGVVVGKVTIFDRRSVPIPRRGVAVAALGAEVERLEEAMADARREVEAVRDALPEDVGADHRLLLETQLMMLGDELLSRAASDMIRADGINAEWALRKAIDRMQARLRDAPEPYFRERADDVGHVGEHILGVLTGADRSLPELTEPSILVASDLSPAEAAQLGESAVIGIVTDAGSASSHTAILARALQVPAVVGVADVTRALGPGDTIIVDALDGEIVLAPAPEELADAEARAERFRAFKGSLREVERRGTRTADGVKVSLFANVELELDVENAKEEGADGIGLYRTEFLYLHRSEAPSEDEQAVLYRRVARRMAPRPVTFRTFDLGADKMPLGMRRGPNPALGLRALRVAFERPELLVTQLRALLRASTEGNVRVMFPMVSGVGDLRRARVLLERAREDLDSAGLAYGPVPVGSMLEVPSAVLLADRLAPVCDFFCVGTNDLTQYALAVDRSDPRVAHLASSLDPAVLRLLERAHGAAVAAGVPISICGDLAADPVATPLLLGLGFTDLSMTMSAIPLIGEVVRRLDLAAAEAVVAEALDQDSAADVERLLSAKYRDVLGELWDGQGIVLPRA